MRWLSDTLAEASLAEKGVAALPGLPEWLAGALTQAGVPTLDQVLGEAAPAPAYGPPPAAAVDAAATPATKELYESGRAVLFAALDPASGGLVNWPGTPVPAGTWAVLVLDDPPARLPLAPFAPALAQAGLQVVEVSRGAAPASEPAAAPDNDAATADEQAEPGEASPGGAAPAADADLAPGVTLVVALATLEPLAPRGPAAPPALFAPPAPAAAADLIEALDRAALGQAAQAWQAGRWWAASGAAEAEIALLTRQLAGAQRAAQAAQRAAKAAQREAAALAKLRGTVAYRAARKGYRAARKGYRAVKQVQGKARLRLASGGNGGGA
ncbi:MAG: hypothetical protein LBR19_03515 [Bifidobacteriaceae bacterium]|jgi:hypothetical protein|nr:hypothetical protein [Bifidobacteriaceae bacterium]